MSRFLSINTSWECSFNRQYYRISLGTPFRVEVKANAKDSSSWWIKQARLESDLYYVLVVRVQGDNLPPPKYWVLKQSQVSQILLKKRKKGKTAQILKSDFEEYTSEGSWKVLPQ